MIAFRFRTAAPAAGHSFHLNIDRPTKGLDVELNYDPAAVAQVSLMDFASRGDGGRISDEPDTSTLRYRYDGWLFPRAGLVFAWSLPSGRVTQSVSRNKAGRSASTRATTAASNDDTRRARAA